MQNKLTIGLTGPTGAGKSMVASLLRARNIAVIDGDAVAREAVTPGSPALKELAAAFGADILRNGELNRRLLANRAFATKKATQTLNAVTHPYINEMILQRRDALHAAGVAVVTIDAAALFEAGADRMCDFTVAVTAPEDVRFCRVLARDAIDEAAARMRIRAQKSREYYESHADMIIKNYPPYILSEELKPLYSRIEEALR